MLADNAFPISLRADQLPILQWLTRHPKYKPNERTIHGATATYFAAQEGRYFIYVLLFCVLFFSQPKTVSH